MHMRKPCACAPTTRILPSMGARGMTGAVRGTAREGARTRPNGRIVFFCCSSGWSSSTSSPDYFLQPRWMLGGKGDFRKIGGYAHAGVHAGADRRWCWCWPGHAAPLADRASWWPSSSVHYLLDYSKIHYSRGVHIDTQPRGSGACTGSTRSRTS